MKLFDATLDLAAFAQGAEDHVISSVTSNRITCNDFAGRVAEFGNGTIWFRTGESAGQFGNILSSEAQTIVVSNAFSDGYAAGDEITIASWQEFDTQKLIYAVNSVLRMYKILKWNDELRYDPSVISYDLPEGVKEDIRIVQLEGTIIQGGVDMPVYTTCHFWKVQGGRLFLTDRHRTRYMKGDIIRIAYVDYHGTVGKDDEIDEQVDPLYLRYMSWLYLCRNLIQKTHKDNLVASDMYNEAKIYERDYGRLPNKRLPLKTMTFPQW